MCFAGARRHPMGMRAGMPADRTVPRLRLMMVRAGMPADRMRFAGARRHPMMMRAGVRAGRTVPPSPLMKIRFALLGASVTDDLPSDDGLNDLATQDVTGERGVPTL